MRKKIFIILAAVLAVALIGMTSAFSAGVFSPKAYIETGDIQYPVAKGSVYVYEYRLELNDPIAAVDATMYYDSEHLKLLNYVLPSVSENSIVYNIHIGELHFVDSSPFGFKNSVGQSALIRAAFFVKGDSGIFDVHTEIKDMCAKDTTRLVDNGKIVGEFEHSELITDPLKETSTEALTEAQTEQSMESVTEAVAAEMIGDADGDGEITVVDATAIQRYIDDIPVANFGKAAADIDGDGEVTIIDASLIQHYVVKMKTSSHIGEPIK